MEIVPHVGIGPVHLGMSREEADWLREPAMQIDSRGNPPVVVFIQMSKRGVATYRGVDLFDEPADEVVAEIVRLEGLNPTDFPPGQHQYPRVANSMLTLVGRGRGGFATRPDGLCGTRFCASTRGVRRCAYPTPSSQSLLDRDLRAWHRGRKLPEPPISPRTGTR